MVFVNGQKFACAACIKGHRSTACNHGERPLHEIKKKGRPSTQCLHCRELRRAKQVKVSCICGRDEGSSFFSAGLKQTKSLSHDGPVPSFAEMESEDLLLSHSTEGVSPVERSLVTDVYSCGCLEGAICTCCRDRTGHVVAKPGKNSSRHAVFKDYPTAYQRVASSLDAGKPPKTLLPKDMPTSAYPQLASGALAIQSPNGSVSSTSSIGLDGSFSGMGIYSDSPSSPFAPALPSGSTGCDHSPSTSSPLSNPQPQVQAQLCFDYASSSDYDSDHYNPSTPYSYYLDTMVTESVGSASGTIAGDNSAMLLNTSSRGTVPIDRIASSSAVPMHTSLSTGLTTSALKEGCCSDSLQSVAPSLPSPSPSPSTNQGDDIHGEVSDAGCGCAISPNMCCCGEMCACPGCLAYPSNQPVRSAVLAPDVYSDGNPSSSSTSNHRDISDAGPNMVRSASQKGSCCGSSKTKASDVINNSSTQALNLSQALSLIEASSQNISGIIDNDARQALRQNLMGQSGMEPVKMQHPTLLGDNGVLICGCGCGRPTVDCADCFRDMCEFVGESQARMMKEELEFDLAMNREGGYLSDLGLNMNMSMAMNMSLSMDMDINMDFNFDEEIEQVNDQGPARSRQGPTESTPLYHEDDLHQGRRQPSQQPTQLQYQKFSDQDQDQGQQQQDHQLLEREQRLRLQLMEQEQMQLSQLQPSTLNQLQLDFLDDEDWSFVDEIRTDGPDLKMLGIQPSDAA